MGFLDNSSITVDAILTKRGREILSEGGDLNIVKFALSDEEVDYTLYDVTHPNGTDSYGAVIENMSLLEATPNRTNFRSFLVDNPLSGARVVLDSLNYTSVDTNANIALNPSTTGAPAEQYTFTIENTNIVRASGNASGKTQTADSLNLVAQSINVPATTTVTVTGVTSGISNVITVSVKADPASNTDPNQRQRSTTNRASGAGAATGGSTY